jgi:hypothetical protein
MDGLGKILLADGEAIFLLATAKALHRAGYSCDIAEAATTVKFLLNQKNTIC